MRPVRWFQLAVFSVPLGLFYTPLILVPVCLAIIGEIHWHRWQRQHTNKR